MSKYKYQKQFLFSTRKLQDIELFLQNEEMPLDLLTIRDSNRNTSIHHCSYLNQHRHIQFYIKYYRRNLQNQGFTLSEIKNKTKFLLDQKNAEGLTAAHYAAFKGNITVLKSLQKYQANLTLPSDLGMNLLHFAAQGDKINTILYLHDKQFDINSKDSKHSTPLHWACFSGSQKIVEYLLSQPSILVNQTDLDGHTPLHIAVAYGYSKIVKKLLVGGSDRKIANLKGETALKIAQQNEFDKIAKMLNDQYSFLDYLKFLCNAKIKYQPRNRSYCQPTIFYCISIIMVALSFALISVQSTALYIMQAVAYGLAITLFTSLIIAPKHHPKLHPYGFFVEREDINHLCMECIRPQQSREYHCTICHNCIAQYDHHCFWINNCVGKHNLFRFNVFLILAQICLIWVGYISVATIVLLQGEEDKASLFFIKEWVREFNLQMVVSAICGVITLLVLLLGVPMICLILVQQKNLLLGKTSYQRFSKSNESVLTRDQSDFLRGSWQGESGASLKNCVGMCLQGEVQEKGSQSNSTSSSFVREH